MFADKIMLNANILGMRVIDRVLSKSNIALVVSKDNSSSYL